VANPQHVLFTAVRDDAKILVINLFKGCNAYERQWIGFQRDSRYVHHVMYLSTLTQGGEWFLHSGTKKTQGVKNI
jgi:hypothetical protein